MRSSTAPTPQVVTIAFANTTVVNADAVQNDVALVVEGARIVAIGPNDSVLAMYPQAEVYDGRGKALLPGLINCHAHMAAVLQRGFNEDFGFPNTARLAISPNRLLEGEERTLMVQVAALEKPSGPVPRRSWRTLDTFSATQVRWRRRGCAVCSRNPYAMPRTSPARCPRGGSPRVKSQASHLGCATRDCSA